MTLDEVRALILSFPGCEAAFSQKSWAFRVNGKLLCRLGVRTGPEDLMLTGIDPVERDALMASRPEVFFSTPHFDGGRFLLVRTGAADEALVRPYLERRYREIAG
jgi:hypothetical protein